MLLLLLHRPSAGSATLAPGVVTSQDGPDDPGSGRSAEPAQRSAAGALIRRLNQAVDPDYEVVRELGGGGMGMVFLARDTALDRVVAIKAIRPELATEAAVQRFLREARILARIHHPNIIPVHRAGTADGLPYYVMEYVEGETLADRLGRGQLTEREAITIGRALLDALAAAHAEGVVHRDVKPANIFLTGGRVLLGDFGVARVDTRDPDATSTNGHVGTPAYMPPEQAAGGVVTEQTDGYAAGMVIYEMLTGHRWVPLAEPAAADWSGVARRFRAPLRRALAWSPGRRWNRVSAFRRALSPRYRVLRRVTISGWIVAAAAIATLVSWLWWTQRSPPALSIAELAILPFEVQTESETDIGTALAALVNFQLDGVPQLSLTPYSAAARRWLAASEFERSDRATFCGSLRAQRCTDGIISIDGEDLEVSLSVYSETGILLHGRVIFRHRLDERNRLATEAARWLVGELAPSFAGTLRSTSALSENMDALWSYYQAEDAFFRDRPDQAIRHYREALQQDSTFALARWHLVNVWRWLPGQTPDLRPDLERLSVTTVGRLGTLDSMLVQAQLLPPGSQRLEAYQEASRAYPRFAFPRMLWGEELFHRGPLAGYPGDSAAWVLEEAVARDYLFAPASVLLAWLYIRRDRKDDALRALNRLDGIVMPGSDSQQYTALLWQAYGERFEPDSARALRESLLRVDPLSAQDPGFALRMPFAFDMPDVQAAFGELLVARGIPEFQASGHYGTALADAARGRGAEALIHLDSATALLGTATAALHAAQWRVLPTALAVPLFQESERVSARASLDSLAHVESVAVRALWTLGLDASLSGNDVRAGQLRDSLASYGSDSTAVRLLGILDAQILAARDDLQGALDASRGSLEHDAHQHHGDPFARSVLHLLRASWFAALARPEDVERELRWAENLDIVGWPGGVPQAVEIDWMLSVYASYLRARNAGNEDTRCAQLNRVVKFWTDAESEIQTMWDDATALLRTECGV